MKAGLKSSKDIGEVEELACVALHEDGKALLFIERDIRCDLLKLKVFTQEDQLELGSLLKVSMAVVVVLSGVSFVLVHHLAQLYHDVLDAEVVKV